MQASRFRLLAATSALSATIGVLVGSRYGGQQQPDQSDPILTLPKLAAALAEPSTIVPRWQQQLQPTYGSGERAAERILRFGYPNQHDIKLRSNYVLSYDRRNRVAHWVFEHVNRDLLKESNADRSKCSFVEDASLHPYFRATNEDFRKSGYDRGHLAPAANHKQSQEACAETFYLSNIAPQVGEGFNQGAWMQLEKLVRYLANRHRNIYVCTGPLYLPRSEANGKLYVKYEVIGANHVAVPTHFFKVIVIESTDGQYYVKSYVLPNQKIADSLSLETFSVSLDVVERAAGLLFFQHNSLYKDAIKPAPLKLTEGFSSSAPPPPHWRGVQETLVEKMK